LSPLDIAFLAIETEATPMNLGGVMVADGGVDGPSPEQLIALLRARAAAVPRLSRKLGRSGCRRAVRVGSPTRTSMWPGT